MASTSNQNSSSAAGWEIIPYVPLPVLNGSEHVVRQSKELSITDVLVGEGKNTRKKRHLCSAKVVGTSYVYFKFLQRGEDPPQHALELIDEESSPQMEEGAIDVEHLLPFPHLLKGWKRETRERPNGTRDKFYFHATSTKMFRSVIEVVEYIKSNNKLEDAKEVCNPKQLKGTEWINPSEASSSKENKRKNSWNQYYSESKQRRSLLGAYSKKSPSFLGTYSEKSPEQIKLEKFYATAYENLLNMFPPTPVAVKAKTKRAVEAFLAEAQANLLRTFEGEKNVRDTLIQSSVNDLGPAEIEEIVKELTGKNDAPQILLLNPEPTNIQQNEIQEPLNPGEPLNVEQLNPQQKEGNGLTEKELEVAQILSNEGLDRSKDKPFTSEGFDRMMANSPPIFDPIDPDSFSNS